MRTLILLLATIISSLSLYSQTPSEPSGDISGSRIPIKPIVKPGPFPKTPSMQDILCYYDGEMLYITFGMPEGICQLTMVPTERDKTSVFTFDSENAAVIYVGNLSDAYILIETSYGHQYEGWL